MESGVKTGVRTRVCVCVCERPLMCVFNSLLTFPSFLLALSVAKENLTLECAQMES